LSQKELQWCLLQSMQVASATYVPLVEESCVALASVSFLFLAVGDVLPYGEVSSTEEVLSEASSSTDVVVAFASTRAASPWL
jgi:hypothetical protein